MPRLNYLLVLERSSDASIHRQGWRPIKPKPYAKLAVGIGSRLYGNVRSRAFAAAAPQEPAVSVDADPALCAYIFEIPARNVDSPYAARRHPKISADTLKAWGTAFPTSLVLESAAISPRKPKAHEESVEPTVLLPAAPSAKTEKARTHMSAESSPVSSRRVENPRTREAEESRLLASVRCTIITVNMKLEGILWPAEIAQAAAAIDFSAPVLIAESATSLNRPIENFQPSALLRKPSSHRQATRELQ